MAKILDMPKLSPTMEEGVLSAWHKKEGDSIAVDDLLAEVETDKATMEFRAFDKGTLLKILVAPGSNVKLGQPVAVVGAPNTGKSSVINALVHRKRAIVQNKAGVTRHVRWIALDDHVDILDTPGVLAPRITSQTVAWQLAVCGILPESAFDAEEVVDRLSAWLGLSATNHSGVPDVEMFARERGMLRRGGEIDRRNAARTYLKEFRAGNLGRVTFELPEERD